MSGRGSESGWLGPYTPDSLSQMGPLGLLVHPGTENSCIEIEYDTDKLSSFGDNTARAVVKTNDGGRAVSSNSQNLLVLSLRYKGVLLCPGRAVDSVSDHSFHQ